MNGLLREHECMDVIAKLADVDPVFREVAATLYPDVDVRELYALSKAMPDTSSVHVNSGPQQKQKMSSKKKLAAGLIAGAGIEAAAAGETIGPLKRDIKAFGAARKAGGTLKAIKPLVPHGWKLHQWGSGTKAALMGGNLLVGLGAAKELAGSKKKDQGVAKAAPSMMTAFADIIEARREGRIDTATALRLIDQVAPDELIEKGAKRGIMRSAAHFASGAVGPPSRMARVARGVEGARAMQVANYNATKGYEREQAINRGRKVAGALTFGTAGALAYRHRSRKLQEQAMFGKADTAPDLTWDGEISKVNEDKRQVFGWCSLSTVNGQPVVDLQDDYVPIEEIEKSAYKYVISSRKGGDMHKRVGKGIYAQDEPLHTADLIESVIITPEKLQAMGVPADAISKVHTGWWVGFQVNDEDQWQKVKSGERAGFSIHGTGTRKMLDEVA